jgi:electron transfer flavoprotein alpha subunit
MKESEFVISVNSDENAPIKDESDILVNARIEDFLPLIIDEIQKIRPMTPFQE